MSRPRKILIYLLLTVLLVGHAYDVASSQEHWPFSPYPMYAEAQTNRTLRVTRLIGITATTPPREIALNATWLRNTLSVWEEGSQYHRDKIPIAAKSYLLRYNHQRLKAKAGMPRLAAIRVYEYVWKMTDHRPGEGKPDQRNLLAQVWMKEYKPTTHPAKKKKKPKPTTTLSQPKERDVAR